MYILPDRIQRSPTISACLLEFENDKCYDFSDQL